MDYRRYENEDEDLYIYRICSMKDVIGNWNNVADILNKNLGNNYGESAYRKKYEPTAKVLKAMGKDAVDKQLLEDIEYQKIELRKEKQKLFDARSAYNEMCRKAARGEEIKDIIQDILTNGEMPKIEMEDAHDAELLVSDNDLLVSLNDLHYGMTYKNYWGEYSPEICEQMLANYLIKIISIAKLHKPENCIVWANGDLISGSIHETVKLANKENVVKQVMHVSELVSQLLAQLSSHFAEVRFVSVAGNHSRLTDKEFAPQDERLDDILEFYAAARLQNYDNIKFGAYEKIDPTMYVVNVRGLNYLGVHGDYDKGVSTVPLLEIMAKRKIYCVLKGHLHHNATDTVQGIKTLMAGSFEGMDDFCISKRINGIPEQIVSVVNHNGIVCNYDINLRLITQ